MFKVLLLIALALLLGYIFVYLPITHDSRSYEVIDCFKIESPFNVEHYQVAGNDYTRILTKAGQIFEVKGNIEIKEGQFLVFYRLILHPDQRLIKIADECQK